MATRDRFGGFAEPASSPLQRYILNACDPQNFEPNLALDLEVADLINAKKGNAPREAAIAIVTHINNRNPNVSLLALTLLDICAKNCGYAFHLQISTKDFLNELVRRFPERPPMRYSRVQGKILELIEEWRQTICQNSKYKEDLGFIRDMHRLLSHKGYTFPAINREDAAVLNPSESLRSAEEMEEEEKLAQSAKLQELIRRGTPHDLQEANRLMKVMAGYDNRHKTDYRAKAAEEVGKVQAKARLLEEMLQEYKGGDKSINDGAWQELSSALASAQPKIQKMCEEESDDTEAVAKLFEINDSIHRTLERYKLVKQGRIEEASQIPKGTLGTSGAGVGKGVNNELSLIDFGTETDFIPTTKTVNSPENQSKHLEDDLLGLSIGDSPSTSQNTNIAPAFEISNLQANASKPSSSNASRMPHMQDPNSQASDLLDSLHGSDIRSETSRAAQAQLLKDPFAVLSKIQSPQSSLFGQQIDKSVPPSFVSQSSSESNLNASLALARKTQAPATKSLLKNGSSPDDEWTFSSSLPNDAQELNVVDSKIQVVFLVSRKPENTNSLKLDSSISNNTSGPISDLTFELAVMKGLTLKLEPQSGRNLRPLERNGITQSIWLNNIEPGKVQAVKLRWRASYRIGGKHIEEQGDVPQFSVV